MLRETIEYVDYNGKTRTEDFYFNLNEAEIIEMAAADEDLGEKLKRIVAANDGSEIMRVFKDFLRRAYGEKSEDGRRFTKSPEITEAFMQTEAYNKLFMRLVTDPEYSANFINGILPKEVTLAKK